MSLRWAGLLLPFALLTFQSCSSPFQPEQVYSPELVVYGIAFRGDTTLVIRVETNSKTAAGDSSSSGALDGLEGAVIEDPGGTSTTLTPEYVKGTNLLTGDIHLASDLALTLHVRADGYATCSSSLTVLDSGIIYPAYYTTDVLRDPSAAGRPAPQFTVYPSGRTVAIRLTMALLYHGVGPDGGPVSGEIDLNPSYQSDTTSYFLKIDGAITPIQFNLSEYSTAYSQALSKLSSGTIVAVVRLLQVDAAVYDFYSISNGFNDPLTMRTEKPVYSNVTDGLGFFGSVAADSLRIQVYP